ncbi:MAG: glycosyltransferase family 1 protein [Patescibacteria group bacterium]|nr:glycosyltransferase family 4 protein [Patescibacteria group bacterium]
MKEGIRIGIDTRALSESKRSGVEEYTENLLDSLFQIDQKNRYILFYNSFKKNLPAPLIHFEKYPNVFLRRFRLPNKLLNFMLWYLKFPKIDKLLKTKILYSPNLIFTAISSRCRHLLTIHDLSFERHPEFFNRYRRFWHWLVNPRKLTKRAFRIITVSCSTKEDLINLYHCPPSKIKRVYPGIAAKLKPADTRSSEFLKIARKYQLPQKYILALSTLEPRKNIDSIIIAYNHLRQTRKITHKLVIAGGQGWLFEKTKDLIKNSRRRQDIILVGEVENKDRQYIYSAADLFVYPSFYEGFGFPPVEALACGTTVICSHISSLPEAVGDSALLVNPYNRNELAWAMERGLKDRKLKKILKISGRKQAKKFNWNKTARLFQKILESAL